MEIIDNINKTLKEDMITTLRSGSKMSIAASSFSIYAFQGLKEQLGDISELRFIVTSPSFITYYRKDGQAETRVFIYLVSTVNEISTGLSLKLNFAMSYR